MDNEIPIEYFECLTLVDYLTLNNIMFTHISNETFTRSWKVKMKNKRMGVSKGFPDYFMIIKGTPVFIEMKRKMKSRVGPEQRIWIDALNKAGIYAFIAVGFDEAKLIIDKFLKHPMVKFGDGDTK